MLMISELLRASNVFGQAKTGGAPESPAPAPLAEATSVENASRAHSSCRILLVSDDAETLKAVAASVCTAGHRPSTARSGEEVIELLKTESFDLIASKFQLPGINGEELAASIKALIPAQLFLLVLNKRDRAPGPHTPSAADLVLHKPFTLEEAAAAFYQLMETRRGR